ncbi:hypothetical protein [Pontiella sulfatireligans]|uniref:Uncharacterized protein n=1 Tax=Pontiella sulfatireligans TaxID=2750658 RepID=A0A6C2UQP1_9BACT|nr:hypothetical protein [Pontiella sulfatireligans]VGO22263.1 hypothetical protein SCARR_04345 [Pontiella sulfatireligans]
MKKIISIAAVVLMFAGAFALAGEGKKCTAGQTDKKAECSACPSEKKAECSTAKKAECSAKKAECSTKKAECTKK